MTPESKHLLVKSHHLDTDLCRTQVSTRETPRAQKQKVARILERHQIPLNTLF